MKKPKKIKTKCANIFPLKKGDKYAGGLINNLPHGKGTFTWNDGDCYIGDFKDGKLHGFGTYTWANDDVFTGNFKNGKRNGKGVFILANGNKFKGIFQNDKMNGTGVLTWKNGWKYVGNFKNNARTGYGKLFNSSGKLIYKGDFKNGDYFGTGVEYIDKNGKKYENPVAKKYGYGHPFCNCCNLTPKQGDLITF